MVSYGEMLRAIKAKIPANKIVFSGVGKTESEISKAIEQKFYNLILSHIKNF